MVRRFGELACLWGACAVLAFARPAFAQPPKGGEPRAVELFEKSVEAYRAGDFASAVELLKQAYALRPAPVLIYNLARAYEGLGQLDDAVQAYEDYLTKEPKPQDRGAIERKVATLKEQIAERARLQREQEALAKERARAEPLAGAGAGAGAGASADADAPPEKASAAPWIVAGIGGAVMLGGGAVLVAAKTKHDQAAREPVQTKAEALAADAGSWSTVGSVVLIGGAAVVVGGVVWGLVSGRGGARSTSGAVRVAPSARGVTLTW